jgi:quercetin dioxygenase-like cupin family protein
MDEIFFPKRIDFKRPIDFNTLSKIMNNGNLKSIIASNYLNEYIFNSVIKVEGVQEDPMFHSLFDYCQKNFNKENLNADLFLFAGFKMGNVSVTHKDNYDVVIIGAHGETVYNLEGKEYRVCPGDLLHIPKNVTHTAIGMTPRIILSYGKYN